MELKHEPLILRNNTCEPTRKEKTNNVVYEFICPEKECRPSSQNYIGRTSTTLRRRLLAHRNAGSIFQHYTDKHDRKPTLQELIDNTKIKYKCNTYRDLVITEAVCIATEKPTINKQIEADNCLPSSRSRTDRGQGHGPLQHRQNTTDEDIIHFVSNIRNRNSMLN